MKKQKFLSVAAVETSTAQAYFVQRTGPQIADWVRIGLEHYVREAGSFSGFSPLEGYFVSDLPVSEGLAAISAAIDSEGRSKLRNGLSETLDSLPVTIETAPVIKQILYCAKRLNASEIFRYLPAKMKGMSQSQGAFFDISAKEIGGRNLFEVAFQVAADMPVEGSGEVLEELIATSYFHFSQAGLALDALCRIDPENFVKHFDRLREPLHEMFAFYETPENIRRLLVKRIIESIGLVLFSEQHRQLRFEAGANRLNDNWFFDGLFKKPEPLLVYREGKIAWAHLQPKIWEVLSPILSLRTAPSRQRIFNPEPEEDYIAAIVVTKYTRQIGAIATNR